MGLVTYLSDGINVHAHYLRDMEQGKSGKGLNVHVLCKSRDCELCYSGSEVKRIRVYPIIDWLSHYMTKSGVLVKRPSFALFHRGKEGYELHELRRAKFGFQTGSKDKDGQGVRTLRGRKWEITRSGTGFHTKYDPLPGDLRSQDAVFTPVDFSQVENVTLTDNNGNQRTIQIPAITMPAGWPEYDEERAEHLRSIYTRQRMRPEYDVDWNNPEHVNLWVKLHFLNVPQEDYIRLGKVTPRQPEAAPAAAQPTGQRTPATFEDDDIPFL